MASRATAIQAHAVSRLTTNDWFVNVPVITQRLFYIENIVDIAVQKLGTCVLIVTPKFDDDQPSNPFPVGLFRLTATVFEQVVINQSATGSQKSALETAELILGLLKGWKLPDADTCFFPDTPTIELVEDPDFLRYDVNMAIKDGYELVDQGQPLASGNNDTLLSGMGIGLTSG